MIPYLMTLARPARNRARESPQRGQIAQDKARLIKGAHEVFARREIDAHFAADRAIDLRQQGRWRLDKRDAPQVSCRDKPGQVADDAAAQSHNERVRSRRWRARRSQQIGACSNSWTFPPREQPEHGIEARLAQRRRPPWRIGGRHVYRR